MSKKMTEPSGYLEDKETEILRIIHKHIKRLTELNFKYKIEYGKDNETLRLTMTWNDPVKNKENLAYLFIYDNPHLQCAFYVNFEEIGIGSEQIKTKIEQLLISIYTQNKQNV